MLTGINLGDVHLGVPSVPAAVLIRGFKNTVLKVANSRQLDIINIAGDLFDRQIHFGRETGFEILRFFIWLCQFCQERNIVLNVLEGTPSHDWKQNKVLEVFANEQPNLTFNYFNDIAVWVHKGVSFLFVPDEWSNSSQITLRAMKEAMVSCGYSNVDIAVMHGQFEYQLPDIALSKKTFMSDEVTALVNHAVLINHIHIHAPRGKIIPPGSLGRYNHGEEAPKGLVYWTLENDKFSWEFIENTDAVIFKTIKLAKDYDKSLSQIQKLVASYPTGSHFRLDVKKNHPARKIIGELPIQYPGYHFVDLVEEEEKLQSVRLIEDLPATEINEQNYLVFLDDYIKSKVDSSRIQAVKARISKL